ncbi:hypothetical protein ACOME3_004610 [Neoechinorhynchus agilis]
MESLQIKSALDADNLLSVQEDLAFRFHNLIVQHIHKFDYSQGGAMTMLQDIGEYRRIISSHVAPDSKLAHNLMNTTQSLMNLLVVQPDTLEQVVMEQRDSLMVSDHVIASFVNLRLDQKTTGSKRPEWLQKITGFMRE